MFKNQQLIADNWSQLNTIFTNYNAEEQLQRYDENVRKFVMRVPLVGLFSAGKSSLINKLLDDKLLSVQITPETAIATELHFSEKEAFYGHKPTGEKVTLSRQDLQEQNFSQFLENDGENNYGWVEAHINAPMLQRFPHLSLVDLPGLESNLISHNRMIDDYVQKSLAYCIVVSIEDGELKSSTQEFLRTLKIAEMPVILVINKSDLKTASDVQAITNKIQTSITDIMGNPPLVTATVSTRKQGDIQPFIQAVTAVESTAAQRFDDVVTLPIVSAINFVNQNLDKLINTDNLTIERLEDEKKQLLEELEAFSKKIDKDTNRLEGQAHGIISRIVDNVNSQLMTNLENLSDNVLHQQSISNTVDSIVRLAVTDGLQNELMPVMQAYIKHIESDMPDSLKVETPEIVTENLGNDGIQFGEVVTNLAPLLAIMKIHPVLTAISVVLPVVAKVFDLFRSNSKKQEQADAQRESARQAVLNQVLPSVKANLQPTLNKMVMENIQKAKVMMENMVSEKANQVQARIQQNEIDIQANQAEQNERKQQYQTDQVYLKELATQLTTKTLAIQ